MISFDAVSSANTNPDAGTLAWSHTIGSGNNKILLVGVALRSNHTVTGITYGSQNLIKIRTDAPASDIRSELWYLPNPTQGTNTITVTASTTSTITAGAISYVNVGGLANNGGATGSTVTASSLTIQGQTGLAVDVIALQSANSSLAVTGAVVTTQRVKRVGTADTVGMSEQPSGAPFVFGWTFTSDTYAESGVVLLPAYTPSAYATGSAPQPSTTQNIVTY